MQIRFGITYIDTNGLRTLLGPAQGRYMMTKEEAENALLDLMRESEDKLVSVCKPQSRGTFRVDAFNCYDHGDPMGIYV